MIHEYDGTGYVCLENEDFSRRQNKEQLLSDAGSASSLSICKRSLKNMSKRHLKICLFSGLFLDSETTPETLLTFFKIFTFKHPGFQIYSAASLSFSKEAVQINPSASPALLLTPRKPLLSKKIHSPLLPSTERRHQDSLP